ncbi:MAG: GxxExxY protein [bacterium]
MRQAARNLSDLGFGSIRHLLCVAHEVQRVHYLTATGIETGLLFNFGAESLQFKRKSRTYSPKAKIRDAMDVAASARDCTRFVPTRLLVSGTQPPSAG